MTKPQFEFNIVGLFQESNKKMLSLSVPALEIKPGIPAETRPKKLQELVAALPGNSPGEAARLILEELQHLNRQAISPESRYKALEIYRRAVLGIAGQMTDHFIGQSLPLSDSALEFAQLAQTLFIELAYGYKHAIIAEQSKLFTLNSNKQLAVLIQRTLDMLSRRLLVDYHTYGTPAAGIWSELHQLYLYALQQGLQDTKVEDGVATSSINLIYKRVLLLALADTHHLPSTDIERVVDYLYRFAQHAQLQPFGTPSNPAGIFLIRLNNDKPPIPLNKFRGTADLRTDILLITVEMARQVHHHLNLLQTGEPPANLNLPEAARDQRYQDVLAHLLKQWGNAPKRQFNRIEKNEIVNMCVGLPAVHFFLSGKTIAQPTQSDADAEEVSLNFADSPIDGSAGTFKSARWMIVNESAGGLALSKFASVQVALRVGELIGLKSHESGAWSVAAMRWASTSEDTPLSVGAQMLAPSAQAILVRSQDHPEPQPALLLPEIPALKQPATLIMQVGSYKAGHRMQLELEHEHYAVLQTRLVERTGSFERFQFSRQP